MPKKNASSDPPPRKSMALEWIKIKFLNLSGLSCGAQLTASSFAKQQKDFAARFSSENFIARIGRGLNGIVKINRDHRHQRQTFPSLSLCRVGEEEEVKMMMTVIISSNSSSSCSSSDRPQSSSSKWDTKIGHR
ncbi:hypothetical protein GPALN_004851 [Globodera pallida]|nr:hypothetical protein GPALN_004851 [Globodera pallida]